uniref:Uncharacterized protein n=1 Tax=Daphnia magna TaxID=35525 RepID=A0A0P5R4Z8_9CRUS
MDYLSISSADKMPFFFDKGSLSQYVTSVQVDSIVHTRARIELISCKDRKAPDLPTR